MSKVFFRITLSQELTSAGVGLLFFLFHSNHVLCFTS